MQDEKIISNDLVVCFLYDSIKYNKGVYFLIIQGNYKGLIFVVGELQFFEEVVMGKCVNCRFDIFFLLLFLFFYFFNGLDCSNVGNVEIQGKKLMFFFLFFFNCVVLLMRIVYGQDLVLILVFNQMILIWLFCCFLLYLFYFSFCLLLLDVGLVLSIGFLL